MNADVSAAIRRSGHANWAVGTMLVDLLRELVGDSPDADGTLVHNSELTDSGASPRCTEIDGALGGTYLH